MDCIREGCVHCCPAFGAWWWWGFTDSLDGRSRWPQMPRSGAGERTSTDGTCFRSPLRNGIARWVGLPYSARAMVRSPRLRGSDGWLLCCNGKRFWLFLASYDVGGGILDSICTVCRDGWYKLLLQQSPLENGDHDGSRLCVPFRVSIRVKTSWHYWSDSKSYYTRLYK